MAHITLAFCPVVGSISTSLPIFWHSNRIELQNKVSQLNYKSGLGCMNRANRNCVRSSAILTIFRGTEVHGPHLHDQGRRSLQNSMQVLATFYMPIQYMILNGIMNGYSSELKSPWQPRLLNVICLCVQIKGRPHIGLLIESYLSRHTFILHINGPV